MVQVRALRTQVSVLLFGPVDILPRPTTPLPFREKPLGLFERNMSTVKLFDFAGSDCRMKSTPSSQSVELAWH